MCPFVANEILETQSYKLFFLARVYLTHERFH
jgi:hypothetical protein